MSLSRFRGSVRRSFGRLCCALAAGLLLGGSGYATGSPRPSEISFAPPIALERLGAISVPVLAADWDRDGRLDLAAVNRDGYWLFYGNGDGTFSPAVLTVPGDGLHQGTAADVNGDGLLDMVVLHNPLGRVLVLLNQGGRTFSSAVNYPVGAEPVDVLASDFNSDGALDLAVSNHRSHGMSVLLNRGDGRFHPGVTYGGANHPGGIVSADFNEDGRVDLAQANLVSGNVRVFLGDGKGDFATSGSYGTSGSYPNVTIAKDFDGDGHTDLAVANVWGHSVSLLFGDGTGRFGAAIPYAAIGYTHGLGDGDFDGDGDVDLVAATDVIDYFVILQNHEAGNFLPPARFSSGSQNTRDVVVADFNADGRPDIVIGNQPATHMSLLLNNTGGAVPPPPPLPAPVLPTLVSVSLTPTRVVGSNPATGTVTLSAPAPKDGVVVALSAGGVGFAATPANVTILEGNDSATFPVTTEVVAGAASAVITATLNHISRTATLAVEPKPTFAPTTNASVTPAPNVYGWNNSEVLVTIVAEGRGVQEIHYTLSGAQTGSFTRPGGSADVWITREGITTITYFARNPGGETETPKTLTVRIDRTPPVITYTGNAGVYSIEQGIHIACSATDAVSGIATHNCENSDSIAWLYSLTEPTVLASAAIDKAGNLATGSTYFFVKLNPKALGVLTQQVTPSAKVAKTLCSKLKSVKETKSGSAKSRARAIASFVKAVKKERGRSLAADTADLLLRLAGQL